MPLNDASSTIPLIDDVNADIGNALSIYRKFHKLYVHSYEQFYSPLHAVANKTACTNASFHSY